MIQHGIKIVMHKHKQINLTKYKKSGAKYYSYYYEGGNGENCFWMTKLTKINNLYPIKNIAYDIEYSR